LRAQLIVLLTCIEGDEDTLDNSDLSPLSGRGYGNVGIAEPNTFLLGHTEHNK